MAQKRIPNVFNYLTNDRCEIKLPNEQCWCPSFPHCRYKTNIWSFWAILSDFHYKRIAFRKSSLVLINDQLSNNDIILVIILCISIMQIFWSNFANYYTACTEFETLLFQFRQNYQCWYNYFIILKSF